MASVVPICACYFWVWWCWVVDSVFVVGGVFVVVLMVLMCECGVASVVVGISVCCSGVFVVFLLEYVDSFIEEFVGVIEILYCCVEECFNVFDDGFVVYWVSAVISVV